MGEVTRPLIGLTGHAGAGKDTVAGVLTRLYGYERRAWADALKLEVYKAFGEALLYDLWVKEDTQVCDTGYRDWVAFVDTHKYDAPDTQYGWLRPLLQFWGTEYRRNLCGDDYWTRQLQLGPGVVVSDCRFPNEVEAIHKAGGVVWRIDRPGHAGDGHASERLIDAPPVDIVVPNGGECLQCLEDSVKQAYTTTAELAARYGVSNHAISIVVAGKTRLSQEVLQHG